MRYQETSVSCTSQMNKSGAVVVVVGNGTDSPVVDLWQKRMYEFIRSEGFTKKTQRDNSKSQNAFMIYRKDLSANAPGGELSGLAGNINLKALLRRFTEELLNQVETERRER
ncbi:17910_t:CDS:2 [Funneliformis caledonium]|uniref:17910_t:CDS:1 n=1 Tax=Funneliformis caledonium TaxID=1117310 RepID=A0A9N9C3E1_9GLOM|nr:17910_t:CDS:2 [Funneliformis caledonium]